MLGRAAAGLRLLLGKRIPRLRRQSMKRLLMLSLLALPLLASLGACVVYDEHGGYYHHPYYWR
jgi:hypothetical protein